MDTIKPCPFCGSEVELRKDPMWHTYNGVTHGYVGSYVYILECGNCGCILKGARNSTIYASDKEAKEATINAWNTRKGASNKEDGCVDELGGIHYHGIGVNPYGYYCGECGRLTCKGCVRSAIVSDAQEENTMSEENAKKLLFAMTPITEIIRVYNLGHGDWEFVGKAGGDYLVYRVYNNRMVTEQ